MDKKPCKSQEIEVRKGPWTMEEDLILMNYIANHGEGVWNTLARSAGLQRTGKSCRLRWLNYLRPDVRRGNITPEEQLVIMDLHAKWGNRWSKIAKHLPGRTDNEIKNYWRTRIQKHIKQADQQNIFTGGGQNEDHILNINNSYSINNEQAASTSAQLSSCGGPADDHAVDDHQYSSYSPTSFNGNNINFEAFPQSNDHHFPAATHHDHHQSNDHNMVWTMEDHLWSMQLLNGEIISTNH